MAMPTVGDDMNEPYDKDPMVKMNDYTKNISQDIFNNGTKNSRTASTLSKSIVSKKSRGGSEYLTKYSVNYKNKDQVEKKNPNDQKRPQSAS